MRHHTNRIASHVRPRRSWIAAGAAALVVALAGCGGYASSVSKQAPSGTTPTQSSPSSGSASRSGIPQHNGGDMDADNNGGPNDGDGNQ